MINHMNTPDIIALALVGLLFIGGLWLFFPAGGGGSVLGHSSSYYRPRSRFSFVSLLLRLISWAFLGARIFAAVWLLRVVSRTPEASNLALFGATIAVYLLYRLRLEFTHSYYGEFKF